MSYPLIRPLLFSLPPETAHRATLTGLQWLHRLKLSALLAPSHPDSGPCTAMGLTFPNRLGLAAGLDKNGEYIDALAALGFGFIEIGTVTPRPQPGNPRPRLFRVREAQALINRMGFNNHGVDALMNHIRRAEYRGILGINIGKNFDTPLAQAVDDYVACLRTVYAAASYVALNISSPNTQDLRKLQGTEELDRLLATLKTEQQTLAVRHGKYVPLAVKLAPDLDTREIIAIADILLKHEVDGVIATNTTLSRQGVDHFPHGAENGGLSGAPLRIRSTTVVKQLSLALAGKIPIIGAGGVMSGLDAQEKIRAGASLVQIYSGLIYRGPELIAEILASLRVETPAA
ncbi:MAG TPA: quinone-dependent dihydroorotate dehydrogenase [Betaproteobacteria bacterium]|nr:quinone-dependent dihydroorotate dehydrogenase [Betaproteobacteria bacterium]